MTDACKSVRPGNAEQELVTVEWAALEIISSQCPPDTIRLWAWARLQSPPLSWLEARALADSGRIATIEAPHPKRKRKLMYYVEIDPEIRDRLGIIAAARAAGWRRDR